ncbi:YdcF family protein [Paenibacillus selenitireducens]|nr:YdcF family protein [Paenibacillus selenitireducens]
MFRRILLVCLGLGLVSFLIIESFVISGFSVNDSDVSDVDYVVVLGAGLKGSEVSTTLRQRLDASAEYASMHKEIPIIVSGGQGPGEHLPEAVAMKDYLVSKGFAVDRILLESKSTSTQENLLFTRKILRNKGIQHPKILIVTSDYHMFRAELIARKLGYETYGISSPSPAHLKPINMIREYFAMVKTIITLQSKNGIT